MKKGIEKKLNLGRVTIQDLQPKLGRDEQKAVRGGVDVYPAGTTNVYVYC